MLKKIVYDSRIGAFVEDSDNDENFTPMTHADDYINRGCTRLIACSTKLTFDLFDVWLDEIHDEIKPSDANLEPLVIRLYTQEGFEKPYTLIDKIVEKFENVIIEWLEDVPAPDMERINEYVSYYHAMVGTNKLSAEHLRETIKERLSEKQQ